MNRDPANRGDADQTALAKSVAIEYGLTWEQQAAAEEVARLRAENETLKHDRATGFLFKDPGMAAAQHIIEEIEYNVANPENSDPNDPTTLMWLMIDVEGLHFTNNRWGHPVGDRYIARTTEGLETVSQFLASSMRSQDRRNPSADNSDAESERREDDDPERRPDIFVRRGGDEFFVVIPFSEHVISKEQMSELINQRMSLWGKNLPPIVYKFAFHEQGKTAEMLDKEADPKEGMRQRERAKKTARKIGRWMIGHVQTQPKF